MALLDTAIVGSFRKGPLGDRSTAVHASDVYSSTVFGIGFAAGRASPPPFDVSQQAAREDVMPEGSNLVKSH